MSEMYDCRVRVLRTAAVGTPELRLRGFHFIGMSDKMYIF